MKHLPDHMKHKKDPMKKESDDERVAHMVKMLSGHMEKNDGDHMMAHEMPGEHESSMNDKEANNAPPHHGDMVDEAIEPTDDEGEMNQDPDADMMDEEDGVTKGKLFGHPKKVHIVVHVKGGR